MKAFINDIGQNISMQTGDMTTTSHFKRNNLPKYIQRMNAVSILGSEAVSMIEIFLFKNYRIQFCIYFDVDGWKI